MATGLHLTLPVKQRGPSRIRWRQPKLETFTSRHRHVLSFFFFLIFFFWCVSLCSGKDFINDIYYPLKTHKKNPTQIHAPLPSMSKPSCSKFFVVLGLRFQFLGSNIWRHGRISRKILVKTCCRAQIRSRWITVSAFCLQPVWFPHHWKPSPRHMGQL